MVVAAAVVALAVTLALLRPFAGGATDRAAPSASITDDPAAPDPSVPPANGFLDGYRLVDDPAGFSTAVPDGWARASPEEPTGTLEVYYVEPDGAYFLRVFEVLEATPEESFGETRGDEDVEVLAGPQPLAEENLSGYSMEYLVTDWEEVTGDDGEIWYEGTVRAVFDIRFRAADGNLYGVAAYGYEDDDLVDERAVAGAARQHFCPQGEACTDAVSVP